MKFNFPPSSDLYFDLDCLVRLELSQDIYRPDVFFHPRTFYHYSSVECIQSMLASGEAWAFDVSTMNDRSEIDFFISNALLYLKHLSKELSNQKHLHFIHGVLEVCKDWREEFSIFSFSFCEGFPENERSVRFDYTGEKIPNDLISADNLVAWRGYSDNGSGAALELGRSDYTYRYANFYHQNFLHWYQQAFLVFYKSATHMDMHWHDFIQEFSGDHYLAEDYPDQFEEIVKIFRGDAVGSRALCQKLNLLPVRYGLTHFHQNNFKVLFDNFLCCVAKNHPISDEGFEYICISLLTIAASYKHPAFEAEREWRLVRISKRGKKALLPDLRETNGREYIKIPLFLDEPALEPPYSKMSPVLSQEKRKLIVALGPNIEHERRPILMRSLKTKDTEVVNSNIPFMSPR